MEMELDDKKRKSNDNSVDDDIIQFSASNSISEKAGSELGYLALSFGENSLLKDIEKEDTNDEILNKDINNSMILETGLVRNRKKSNDSLENVYAFEQNNQNILSPIYDFFRYLLPKYRHKLKYYAVLFFFFLFLTSSNNFIYLMEYSVFFTAILIIDMGTLFLDNFLFFYIINNLFIKRYDIAYLLHGFNGPLGNFLTTNMVSFFLKHYSVTNNLLDWSVLVSALNTIILLIIFKNILLRRHYTSLLEKRFLERLFILETWVIILSELSISKPPKPKDNKRNPKASHRSSFLNMNKKVSNVFSELVQKTSRFNDDDLEDAEISNLVFKVNNSRLPENIKESLPSSQINEINSEYVFKLKEKIRKRQTFWDLASKLSQNIGTLRVMTYDGPVFIKKKSEAKSFGKNLFFHLSRGKKVKVSKNMLKNLFFSGIDENTLAVHNQDFNINDFKNIFEAAKTINDNGIETENTTLLFETALKLFDPYATGVITEDQCIAAMYTVYKETRFAATSINNFGEVHASLFGVIDFFFWIIIFISMQAFMKLNLFTSFVPFFTLGIALSFAVSKLVGNLFLAIIYVFFMSPYDIGNKIMVGNNTYNPIIVGYVKGINLLYTSIQLYMGQLMKIPNHVLYNQNIVNYAESTGAVYQIDVKFNMVTEDKNLQKKINSFFRQIEKFVKAENKEDWEDIFIASLGPDSLSNSEHYAIYVTHRENLQDFSRSYNARTKVILEIRRLIIEMKLPFAKIGQPVRLQFIESNEY